MMLIVNSVVQQQKENSSSESQEDSSVIEAGTDLGSPDFFEDVLQNPKKYEIK